MPLSDAIDIDKPVQGNPTTQSVRENFAATKSAIAQLELTAGVGPKGDTGPAGPNGVAATVAIGTVTTGAAGSVAAVTNSGTTTAATLNFTIPRGDSGTGGAGITETQARDAVRQGQVRFEEATVVDAPSFPASPNQASGAPTFGSEWALGTGSGVTGGYDHTATTTVAGTDSTDVLAYSVNVVAGSYYQIVFAVTNGNTNVMLSWGSFGAGSMFLRNGATNTANQQTVISQVALGDTMGFLADRAFTHLVFIPRTNWTGRFTLTRVARQTALNSITFNLKDQQVMVRPGALVIGNGGKLQTSTPNNFGVGTNALLNVTTGTSNVAIGSSAMQRLTTGSSNVSIGNNLATTTTGGYNVGIGSGCFPNNVSGSYNIGLGTSNGGYTANSSHCICMGQYAGLSIGSGNHNIALGNNSVGYGGPPNTVALTETIGIGYFALAYVIGDFNTAVGCQALGMLNNGTILVANIKDTTSNNVAFGYRAGRFLANGTASLTRAGNSVFIGADSRGATTDDHQNQIVIGYKAVGHGANTITLGNDEITDLYCNVSTISALSDPRIKEEVSAADLGRCLDAVKGLAVHRWRWSELAGNRHDHHVTGFLSDEVQQIFPKAVVHSDEWRTQRDADGNAKTKLISEQVIEGTQQEDGSWKQTAHSETRQIEDRVLIKDCARVSLTEMLPTLWGAVQQIIQRLEALEAKS